MKLLSTLPKDTTESNRITRLLNPSVLEERLPSATKWIIAVLEEHIVHLELPHLPSQGARQQLTWAIEDYNTRQYDIIPFRPR